MSPGENSRRGDDELNNREKCKLILDVSGNEALDMIIAGAPIGIKAIINKIM